MKASLGFTLIELLTALVVLAAFAPVLSIVSVPQLASLSACPPMGAAWTTYPGGAAVTFVIETV